MLTFSMNQAKKMAIAFAVVLISSLDSSSADTLNSYLEKVALSRLGRLQLKKPLSPSGSLPGKSEVGSFRFKELPSLASVSRIFDVKVVNGLPELLIENGGRSFRVRFGPAIHTEFVAERILQRVGFQGRTLGLVKSLDLEVDDVIAIAQKWSKAPLAPRWHEHLSEPVFKKGAPASVVTKEALVELIEPENQRWKFSTSLSESEAQLLLSLVWLQCPNVLQKYHHVVSQNDQNGKLRISTLRHCLGNTRTTATPNLFPHLLIDRTESTINQLTLNMFFEDEAYKKAFSQVAQAQIESWLQKTVGISEANLVSDFEKAGFPATLAQVMAAKLISRRNSVASYFAPGLKTEGVDYRTLNDSPYIKEGELVESYPHFQADSARFVMEELFYEMSHWALEKLERSLRYMVAVMPFADLYKIGSETKNFGVTSTFRLKRSIDANPNPTGPSDLFLLRDEIDFLLFLGAGVEKSLGLLSLWGRVGGGYGKTYLLQRPVSSLKEAEKTILGVPLEIMWNKEAWSRSFQSLRPGEALAVRSNIFAGLLGGGKSPSLLPIGSLAAATTIPYVSPNFLVMAGGNWGFDFQVHRGMSGDFSIIEGDDISFQSNFKGFWRALHRYVRIPFARLGYKNGLATHRRWHLRDQDFQGLSEWDSEKLRMSLSEAARMGDTEGLQRFVTPVDQRQRYNQHNSFLDLRLFHSNHTYRQVDLDETQKGQPGRYVNVLKDESKFGFRDIWGRTERMKAFGGIEFTDASRTVIRDSYLTVALSSDEEGIQATKTALLSFLTSVFPETPLQFTGAEKLQLKFEFYDQTLRPFLERQPTSWMFDLPAQFPDAQPGELAFLTHSLRKIFSQNDAKDRLDQFKEFVLGIKSNPKQVALIISRLPGVVVSVTSTKPAKASDLNELGDRESVRQFGTPMGSSMKDYLRLHEQSDQTFMVH